MILRHPNCKLVRCEVCLSDHEALQHELERRTGTDQIDHLGCYRRFMDARLGQSSETEWGWSAPVIFEEVNIEAYVRDWKGDES